MVNRHIRCYLTLHIHRILEDIAVERHGLPSNLVKHWALFLAERRRDKVAHVRAAAVRAISQLPSCDDSYVDGDNKEFLPNDCTFEVWALFEPVVFESLRDSAVEVRQAAIQSLILRTAQDIESCLTYLENEDDSDVRKALVEHLVRSTHIRAFTVDTRMRLLRLMMNDENCWFCPIAENSA
ncbi:hypothetical protein ANCCAN_30228 [Ancylostoma caninum]|uniref:HEAT repeat protein n=1 Tax=Ancylostoma caninum TaxID=29170 RepID=A0A368EWG9_ANCCA|nr:hypothetical protein ANCCAN_30228 [Ancylostoma caninum]